MEQSKLARRISPFSGSACLEFMSGTLRKAIFGAFRHRRQRTLLKNQPTLQYGDLRKIVYSCH